MNNFYVKYKGEIIGVVKNNKYTPKEEQLNGVFDFLKREIDNVDTVNFFTNRIDNCKQFGLRISYSTDDYELEPL